MTFYQYSDFYLNIHLLVNLNILNTVQYFLLHINFASSFVLVKMQKLDPCKKAGYMVLMQKCTVQNFDRLKY